MENFTINLSNLHAPSLAEFPHLPPASDSAAQKRLYWFFRGLESMLERHLWRMEPWLDFLKTTGLHEDEVAEFDELWRQKCVLEDAVNWAGRLYGGEEYEGAV